MLRRALLVLLVAATAPSACTVVDVRNDDGRAMIHSDGLINGFASAGWAHDPSFARVELLDGRSRGALALIDLWYLARVEVGIAGAAVGVGPLDFGIGTLFYDPVSPARPWAWSEEHIGLDHEHQHQHQHSEIIRLDECEDSDCDD